MTTKIMIVDDNDDMRYTLKIALESHDATYKITEANSGSDCLHKVSKSKPDIILMDIMMPEMDGLETVVKIKEDSKNEKIKIIFVSATTDMKSRNMAKIAGDDFIEKPFEPSDLDKRIKKVLKQK